MHLTPALEYTQHGHFLHLTRNSDHSQTCTSMLARKSRAMCFLQKVIECLAETVRNHCRKPDPSLPNVIFHGVTVSSSVYTDAFQCALCSEVAIQRVLPLKLVSFATSQYVGLGSNLVCPFSPFGDMNRSYIRGNKIQVFQTRI